MERNDCQHLEDTLLTLLEVSKSQNEALVGVLGSIRTILQVLEELLGSSGQVVCLQQFALLLEVQILGVLAYALWRVWIAEPMTMAGRWSRYDHP